MCMWGGGGNHKETGSEGVCVFTKGSALWAVRPGGRLKAEKIPPWLRL